MDHLSLSHADLIFLECRVVLSDQHGGRGAIAAAVAVLGRRGKDDTRWKGQKEREIKKNKRTAGKRRENEKRMKR